MNICFLYGKIISDIDFKFIMNNKNKTSISVYKIQLNNKSIVTVKGYNEIADYCYRNLKIGDNIYIQGRLNNMMEIEADFIEKI